MLSTGQTDGRIDGVRRAMSNFIQRSNEERKCVWEGRKGRETISRGGCLRTESLYEFLVVEGAISLLAVV